MGEMAMHGSQGGGRRATHARLLGAAVLAMIAVLAFAPSAVAITGWTGPNKIANGSFWTAWVGVDGSGKLHIVATDDQGLLYRTNKSGHWKTVRLHNETRPFQDDVSAGVDRAGHVYIAWARGCGCNSGEHVAILYLTDRLGGPNHGWPAAPTTLVSGHWNAPALKLRGGKIHLVYVSDVGVIKYRTNASGSWVTTKVSSLGATILGMSLAVDTHGKAHVAWGTPGGAIEYAGNTGTLAHPSFSAHKVPGSGCTAQGACDSAASLVLDKHDHPHIAWDREIGTTTVNARTNTHPATDASTAVTGGEGIYYAIKRGVSWTPPSQRRILKQTGTPQLLLDGNGHAHIDVSGIVYLTNTTGSFIRTHIPVSDGPLNSTASMGLSPSGKARLIWEDDGFTGGDGLYLLKEQ
jgi:hypothetical protein